MLKVNHLSGFGGRRSRGGNGLYWAYSGAAGRASMFSDERVLVPAAGVACVVNAAFGRDASIAAGANIFADGSDFYALVSDIDFTWSRPAAMWLYKFSVSGNSITLTWQKRYTVSAQGIAAMAGVQMVADATYIYVPFSHDPGAGGDFIGAGVAKIAKADGAVAWAYRYASSSVSYTIFSRALALPSSGGGVIASGSWETLTGTYGYIYKLDSSGSRVWHKSTDLNLTFGGCAVDPSSGVIYAAHSSGLVKMPSDASAITWGRDLGAGALDVAVDASGNVWTSGSTIYNYDSSGTLIGARALSASARLSVAGSQILLAGAVGSNGYLLRTAQSKACFGTYRVGASSTLSYVDSTPTAAAVTPTLGSTEPPTKGALTFSSTTPTNSFSSSAPTSEGASFL